MNNDYSEWPESYLSGLEAVKERIQKNKTFRLKLEEIESCLLKRNNQVKNTQQVELSTERDVSNTISTIKEKNDYLRQLVQNDRSLVAGFKASVSGNLSNVKKIVDTITEDINDRTKLIQLLHLNTHRCQDHHVQATSNADTQTEFNLQDDNKIRSANLEENIYELLENLKEKDDIISAKTKRITKLSGELSHKCALKLETLEEMQRHMREMQKNFLSIEEEMKQSYLRLEEASNQRKEKCLLAEKNLRISENARSDLSKLIDELKKEVATLHLKNNQLVQLVDKSHILGNEMTDALNVMKQTTAKKMVKFKLRLKTIKEMSMDANLVESLQEQIVKLEEEKIDLQTALIHFNEDQQEQCSVLKKRITDLEQELSEKGDVLDQHGKVISKLEFEKLNIIKDIEEHRIYLSNKESFVCLNEQLLSEIAKLQMSNDIMKAVELEEQLEAFTNDTLCQELEKQACIDRMKEQLTKQEETIKELQNKLSSKQNEKLQGGGDRINLKSNSELESWKKKYFEIESKFVKLNNLYRKLEANSQKNYYKFDSEKLYAYNSRLEQVEQDNKALEELLIKSRNSEESLMNVVSELEIKINSIGNDLELRCKDFEIECNEDTKILNDNGSKLISELPSSSNLFHNINILNAGSNAFLSSDVFVEQSNETQFQSNSKQNNHRSLERYWNECNERIQSPYQDHVIQYSPNTTIKWGECVPYYPASIGKFGKHSKQPDDRSPLRASTNIKSESMQLNEPIVKRDERFEKRNLSINEQKLKTCDDKSVKKNEQAVQQSAVRSPHPSPHKLYVDSSKNELSKSGGFFNWIFGKTGSTNSFQIVV